jgi:hypothetical protein
MTALVDSGYISRKKFPFNNFRASDLHFTSQAFAREPNALPKLCNCLKPKSFGSPGRIRTSNISVNSGTLEKSRCRVWCRLQGIGSHFPFSSCTQCCTQDRGNLRPRLRTACGGGLRKNIEDAGSSDLGGRRADSTHRETVVCLDFSFFMFLENSSGRPSPSTAGFPLPTRARIRLTLVESARPARSLKYSSVRIAETFLPRARVINWFRATPCDFGGLAGLN